ncbi:formimidoylglutamate deiminase [Rathayibacter tanaceti]|uniref:8-oxoguanine deaminase n=1 Tax=Rathayibacter tanaceti TaxID=1671680 RepID=A0A166I3N7_9MICO|nr:formimidoylglutamate deiminase [Rathayibacter tanaceti]KZX21581.1 8-oxoguanine deaminase [Rathayibacter tanaceti]
MSGATSYWAAQALLGDRIESRVRITAAADGTISSVAAGVDATAVDTVLSGVVHPGAVNAHSHAFHRLLRGRTHGDGGSFWTWRDLMYREALRLDPPRYEEVATAVYAEMVAAGWTSVAEFHYVHHRPDGTPYSEPHAMERALARAATTAGIRLTLLDTCYLTGGIGEPLSAEQTRFGDGSIDGWLGRLGDLRRTIASEFDPARITVGAALHSVRAVPAAALSVVSAELDPSIPLHMHVSEQPAENEQCLRATGLTPIGLLEARGLLSTRFSAVHATHLSPEDIELLGAAGSTVVMCPTTEADLGDGIGSARALSDAGAVIALGTDQHAVVDPLLEARALEHGERLGSGRRGRFSPAELLRASARAGRRAPAGAGRIEEGLPCDLLEIDPATARTAGSEAGQLVLSATAGDVATVVVAGQVIARGGVHAALGEVGALLAAATGRAETNPSEQSGQRERR